MRVQDKTWPAASTNNYAAIQPLNVNGGSLALIGTQSGLLPSINYGIRTVSITSGSDLSETAFTINGFQYGQPKSCSLLGPNATTVETPDNATGWFDSISSITYVGDPTIPADSTVSVGSGSTGYLTPFLVSPHITGSNISAGAIVVSSPNITYSIFASLELPFLEYPDTGPNLNHFNDFVFNQTLDSTDLTETVLFYSEFPFQMVVFQITASSADGALTASVLQQGIN